MADNKIDQTDLVAQAARAAAKAIGEELLPAAIAAATLAAQKHQEPQRPQLHAAPLNRQVCHLCGQALSGCEGEHVKAVVFPKRYPEHGDFFQGVFLNGVRYLSNDDSHEILIPKNAAANVEQLVQAFENNEQETRVGRKAERYSGRVSPTGSNMIPQSQGWR